MLQFQSTKYKELSKCYNPKFKAFYKIIENLNSLKEKLWNKKFQKQALSSSTFFIW